jgi:single-strand DNA-binding protein
MSRINNSALLIGRIGQSPEIRHTQSGTIIANFSLATNNKYKSASGEMIEDTEWHRIVCFGKLAEIVSDIAEKGQQVAVRGRITYNEWEKDGVKRRDMQVKAEDFQILSSKPNSTPPEKQAKPKTQPTPAQANGYNDPADKVEDAADDDLPF